MKQLKFTLSTLLAILLFSSTSFAAETLFMATTTSTDNTGLLDYLQPHFTKDTGINLKWTATGTGKALKLGQNCDADVLMVHAPSSEKKFITSGYGTGRREIMYNDFIIIGPAADKSGIKGKSVSEALTLIKKTTAPFVSRGDNSGTNKKELKLWKNAKLPVPDKEKWYVQTGQGMLATINAAAERKGYTMTDRGTYIKYNHSNNGKAPLVVLVEGDKILLNQYSVIPVNTKNCPKAENDLAAVFSDWLAGKNAQKLIGNFKLLGKQLFTPNAKL